MDGTRTFGGGEEEQATAKARLRLGEDAVRERISRSRLKMRLLSRFGRNESSGLMRVLDYYDKLWMNVSFVLPSSGKKV